MMPPNIAKLMKFLSGVAALVGRKSDRTRGGGHAGGLRDANAALIRERRELRKRLQGAESDANRGNEHAAELDRVKSILRDRHGISVSRAQIADAVEDLSKRLEAASSGHLAEGERGPTAREGAESLSGISAAAEDMLAYGLGNFAGIAVGASILAGGLWLAVSAGR